MDQQLALVDKFLKRRAFIAGPLSVTRTIWLATSILVLGVETRWEQVIPFFSHPAEVRKMIYATNAIESLHMQLRKIIKTWGHFPNDDAAVKLLYWR
jgi:hypothetical protein